MNLDVEEQAQRRKKDKRSSRKRKDRKKNASQQPIQTKHKKIFQTKIIQIQQRKIGLIIGQNGKNIKELYQHTHCDVILPKQKRKRNDDIEYDEFNDKDYYYVYDSYNNTEETNINLDDEKEKKTNNENEEEEDDEHDPKKLIDVKLRGTPEEIRDAELEISFMIKHGRLMLEHERSGDNKKKKLKIGLR